MSMDKTDDHRYHHIDWTVIFVSWATFSPEEHVLDGVITLSTAVGVQSTKAKTHDSEVLRARDSITIRLYRSAIQI